MTPTVETVTDFIVSELLPPDAGELTETTPLVSSGILDSMATLKLVDFLERRFGIRIESDETDADHFETIVLIAALVEAKLAEGGRR
jgi:acyl carrier protein